MLSICCNIHALNHEEIGKICKEYKKLSILKKYNWKGINYASGKDDWKGFEKNNPKIALNVLYIKKMNIYPVDISKHDLNNENQIILSLIWDWKMVLSFSKKLSALLSRNEEFINWVVFICLKQTWIP